jgi:hypothetical protein
LLDFETKKAADLLKTDGSVETAYDVILVLLTHDHLLMVLGENEKEFLVELGRKSRQGTPPYKK